MGNCLVVEAKVVRVMKSDGKILEYKHPIKVHQVLSEFCEHAISDKLQLIKHMNPNAEMVGGRLYYLHPLPPVPPPRPIKKKKKVVRFSDEVVSEDGGPPSGIVRIKVVMSKKELQRLILSDKLGQVRVAVDDDIIISKHKELLDEEVIKSKGSWSPSLDSIPEIHP